MYIHNEVYLFIKIDRELMGHSNIMRVKGQLVENKAVKSGKMLSALINKEIPLKCLEDGVFLLYPISA